MHTLKDESENTLCWLTAEQRHQIYEDEKHRIADRQRRRAGRAIKKAA